MMPSTLTRLLALFCEGFGQTSYMIKISGKRRPIWLLGTIEKRFKTWQSFCTESISTRLLSDKPDHKHPWLNHGFLELFLPNFCFATTYKVNPYRLLWEELWQGLEEKVSVTNVTITRLSIILRPRAISLLLTVRLVTLVSAWKVTVKYGQFQAPQ